MTIEIQSEPHALSGHGMEIQADFVRFSLSMQQVCSQSCPLIFHSLNPE